MSDFGAPPPPPDGQPYDPNQAPGYRPHPGPQPGPEQGPPAPQQQLFAGLGGRLGERGLRRPEPRFSVSIAGAGTALAMAGTLIWAGEYLITGLFSGISVSSSSSTSISSSGSISSSSPVLTVTNTMPSTDHKYLGAALFAAITALGYVLMATRKKGALATAGAVASAFGLPLTLVFLTFDVTDTSSGLPFNLDLVYWLSIVVWLGSYLFVPGARGRSLYLFLAPYYLYTYVLFKAARSDVGVNLGSSGSSGLKFHGFGTVAAVSLVFGIAYYLLALVLDRAGRHGVATGLMVPAFFATAAGIAALGPNTSKATVGVILVIVGAALCWYAGQYGRRFTCWAWAASVPVGIVLVVADASPHNATAAGVSLLVVGAIIVALAHAAGQLLREPDDLDTEAVVRSR